MPPPTPFTRYFATQKSKDSLRFFQETLERTARFLRFNKKRRHPPTQPSRRPPPPNHHSLSRSIDREIDEKIPKTSGIPLLFAKT